MSIEMKRLATFVLQAGIAIALLAVAVIVSSARGLT